MISELRVDKDDAGFPIVVWTETRPAFGPGGSGSARVECRITKDASGILQFTVRGVVRHGAYERGKPLSALTGFTRHAAESLYASPEEQAARTVLGGKSAIVQTAIRDRGQVILAEFGGDEPIHLNYAEAEATEFERLEVALRMAFLDHRRLSAGVGKVLYRWPTDDDKVETYDAARREHQVDHRGLYSLLLWTSAAGLLAALLAAIMWAFGFHKLG